MQWCLLSFQQRRRGLIPFKGAYSFKIQGQVYQYTSDLLHAMLIFLMESFIL